jgi:hypothetical protein
MHNHNIRHGTPLRILTPRQQTNQAAQQNYPRPQGQNNMVEKNNLIGQISSFGPSNSPSKQINSIQAVHSYQPVKPIQAQPGTYEVDSSNNYYENYDWNKLENDKEPKNAAWAIPIGLLFLVIMLSAALFLTKKYLITGEIDEDERK